MPARFLEADERISEIDVLDDGVNVLPTLAEEYGVSVEARPTAAPT